MTALCQVCHKPISRAASFCGKCRPVDFSGERNPFHELTDGDVLAIRAAEGTQEAIAKEFNTSRSNVSLIRRLRAWRHL